MNKNELIEKYKELENGFFDIGALVVCQLILKDLEQLDEPEKVKIPQSVVDWIEHFKKCSGTLYGSTAPYSYYGRAITDGFEGDVIEVLRWIRDNSEVYARAWLDGYEVEKEPKYTVKFKATNQYLCDDDGIGLHISPSFRSNFRKSDLEKLSLTEVFDSPLFEVEEVE